MELEYFFKQSFHKTLHEGLLYGTEASRNDTKTTRSKFAFFVPTAPLLHHDIISSARVKITDFFFSTFGIFPRD